MVRFVWAAAISLALGSQSWAAGYGSVEGQFILEGELPAAVPLVRKGDATAKDPAVCAVSDIPDDARSFDPQSKGIGNIFIYLKSAPSEIYPGLKTSATKEVEFDQKGCRFLPHGLIVRTDQTVTCKSDDEVAHNVHTNPLVNNAKNLMVQPKDRKGIAIEMPNSESRPVKVQCDIHPWMVAYWMVIDHPYAAITDKDGKFKIENLPAGEHEFRVWHEDAGFVDRKLVVKIKDGETVKLPTKAVPLASFKK